VKRRAEDNVRGPKSQDKEVMRAEDNVRGPKSQDKDVMEEEGEDERDGGLGLDNEADFLVDAAWRQVRPTTG
jgi:hypothetical protein